jgi:hypothetical protein
MLISWNVSTNYAFLIKYVFIFDNLVSKKILSESRYPVVNLNCLTNNIVQKFF